jgi:hypothetical protein
LVLAVSVLLVDLGDAVVEDRWRGVAQPSELDGADTPDTERSTRRSHPCRLPLP